MAINILESLNELTSGLTDDDYNLSYKRTDNGYQIESSKYQTTFINNLAKLRDIDKFCDIVLKAKSVEGIDFEVKAHKIVIASASQYFRAMFTSGYSDESKREICFTEFDFTILKQIVDFIYTSKLLVNAGNVLDLLAAANMLQIDDIVNACCLYLYKNMDPTNCISIEEYARQYGCMKLVSQAKAYLKDHFTQVVHTEEFMNLDVQKICHLLHQDDISVPDESFIFKAVIDWVRYDADNRRIHLDNLFKCVRFYYLPPQFIKDQMTTCDLLKSSDSDKGRDFLQNQIDYMIAHRPCPYSMRQGNNLQFGFYVLGGYHRQSISLVECFKFSSTNWERCEDMKYPRSGIACVTMKFYIYVIGGRNNSLQSGNVDSSDVECFDPIIGKWRACASLSVARSRAGAGVIDGDIYVCGGACGSVYHSSVEKYTPSTNQWLQVTPMLIPRMGLCCVVVNRLLYAIGGYDGANRLNQVECYNPEKNSWYFVAPMIVPRSGAGCSALDNDIFVVGGYTTDVQLNTGERYDTINNQWSFIAPMTSPRSALSCVTFCNNIFIFGGYTGREFLSKVEVYDPRQNKWSESKLRLTSERSGHAVVNKFDLENTNKTIQMYKTRKALKSLQYSPKGLDIAGLPIKSFHQSTENLKQQQQMKEFNQQTSAAVTPLKRLMSRNEEKENPTSSKYEQQNHVQHVQIQCKRSDEDLMFSDEPAVSYWKVMIKKRKDALANVINENQELHTLIEGLNQQNEMLREENKELLGLLDEVNSIKTLINEEDSGYTVDANE